MNGLGVVAASLLLLCSLGVPALDAGEEDVWELGLQDVEPAFERVARIRIRAALSRTSRPSAPLHFAAVPRPPPLA